MERNNTITYFLKVKIETFFFRDDGFLNSNCPFQAPSKKKKKNKNRDIDIIESVQEHLANIRKIQEESERALGENPGDDLPMQAPESKKQRQKAKEWKKGKNERKDKSGTKDTEGAIIDKSEAKDTPAVTIEIDDSESDSDDDVEIVKEEFKPYDYKEGAKKLLEGKYFYHFKFDFSYEY